MSFRFRQCRHGAVDADRRGAADEAVARGGRRRRPAVAEPTNDTNIDANLAENMWRGEGTSNQYPSASGLRRAWNQNMSSYFMESGSYFRLQNVRLSYTFFGSESKWPETRLTFTAERPLTIFKYNGFNPEVADGIDREVYPIPAVYTFGVMIKL